MGQPLIAISRKQAYYFAGFFVLYEFLTYIANDMILPGMLQVVATFKGQDSSIPTALTAYILGGASLQLILGPLSDRFGRRPIMLIGVSIFFLCTLLITLSQTMTQFIVGRFFQGMGLCFIGVVGYATVQEIFEEMDAVRLISIMANIAILAPAIGPVAGAVVIYYINWQSIFYGIGFFALIALTGLWFFMPEPVGELKRDGEIIKKSAISFSVVVSNYKQLIKNSRFILGSLAVAIIALPCLAWIALAPIMLIKEAQLTVIQYSLWQIPLFLVVILGNWLLHRLTHRFDLKKIIWLGSLVAIIGLSLTYIGSCVSTYYLGLIPGLIIYFFSFGLTSAPLNRYTLFSTAVSKGTASALLSLIMMVILSVGIEIANSIYVTHYNNNFGLFCVLSGLIYVSFVYLMFKKNPEGN